MQVELSPTYVTPYPEVANGGPGTYTGSVINAGQSYPSGMPNPIGSSFLLRMNQYCSPNCLATFQAQAIRDKFGIQTITELRSLAAIDQKESEGKSQTKTFKQVAADIMANPRIHEGLVKYPKVNRVFSGNIFTPFHALAHAMFGGGVQATYPIGNIGLNVDLLKVPDFMAALHGGRPVGITSLDISFPHNTLNDSGATGLTLGFITLRLVGRIEKNSSGSWVFIGEIRAFNDTYDANSSTHRNWLGEELTKLLAKFPMTPYEVVISGSIPVRFSAM